MLCSAERYALTLLRVLQSIGGHGRGVSSTCMSTANLEPFDSILFSFPSEAGGRSHVDRGKGVKNLDFLVDIANGWSLMNARQ